MLSRKIGWPHVFDHEERHHATRRWRFLRAARRWMRQWIVIDGALRTAVDKIGSGLFTIRKGRER